MSESVSEFVNLWSIEVLTHLKIENGNPVLALRCSQKYVVMWTEVKEGRH